MKTSSIFILRHIDFILCTGAGFISCENKPGPIITLIKLLLPLQLPLYIPQLRLQYQVLAH